MELIAANLRKIEERIDGACRKSGRRRDDVLLVAVSKTFPAAMIDAAVAAGITDVGENRVQEYRDKAPLLKTRPRAHLIGNLQTNKVNDAVRLFDVIETVDRLELAEKLQRAAASAGRVLDVLLQVNVSGETQKSGCAPEAVLELAAAVRELPSLRLIGLMTVPPNESAEDARPFFRSLRAIGETLKREGHAAATHLSMGMSQDFEVAIEEGATMIRLGRAVFGDR